MEPDLGIISALGLDNQELLVRVLDGMKSDASEEYTSRIRQTLKQLQAEVRREQARRGDLLTNLSESEDLARVIVDKIERGQATPALHLLYAAVQARICDLKSRIDDWGHADKVQRISRLRSALDGIESRAKVARVVGGLIETAKSSC